MAKGAWPHWAGSRCTRRSGIRWSRTEPPNERTLKSVVPVGLARRRGKGELLMVEYHKSSPALAPPAHWGVAAPMEKYQYRFTARRSAHVYASATFTMGRAGRGYAGRRFVVPHHEAPGISPCRAASEKASRQPAQGLRFATGQHDRNKDFHIHFRSSAIAAYLTTGGTA